jgi:hypothetical protein
MAWVRLDDAITEHPKVLDAGPLALALHVAALCFANRHLTDGFIHRRKVATLFDFSEVAEIEESDLGRLDERRVAAWRVDPHVLASQLESAGLWEWDDEQGGWQIHDYLEYQPSREQVLADRAELSAKRADAGRRGAERRWGVSHDVAKDVATHKTPGQDGKDSKPIAKPSQRVRQTDSPNPNPLRQEKPKKVSLALETSANGSKTDFVWEGFGEVFGPHGGTSGRKARNTAVAEVAQAIATETERTAQEARGDPASHAEVVARTQAWPLHFPNATLTPAALAKHWVQLGRPPLRATPEDVDRYHEDMQRQRRKADALAADLARAKGLPQ